MKFPNPKSEEFTYILRYIEARIWEKGIQEFEGVEISESQKDRPLCCRGN